MTFAADKASGRDTVLDSLRGFAIILVIMSHLPGWMKTLGINSETGSLMEEWLFSFHMPLFFMLSGYVQGMRPVQQGKWAFLRQLGKNFMVLYVPCLFFSYLQAGLNFLVFSSSNSANVHIPGLHDFLTIPFLGFFNYWFLCSLFFVKTAHNFFESVTPGKYIHAAFWVIIFILAENGMLPEALRLSNGLFFHIGFIIGGGKYISREKNPGAFSGTVLLAAGLIFFSAFHFEAGNEILVRNASALCMCLSLMTLFYALGVSNKFLSMCGIYSMAIYCIHNYAAMIFRILYRVSGLQSSGLVFLPYAMCFAVTLLVPLGVVWLYKNVKCLRWIEYVFYPGKLIFRE